MRELCSIIASEAKQFSTSTSNFLAADILYAIWREDLRKYANLHLPTTAVSVLFISKEGGGRKWQAQPEM